MSETTTKRAPRRAPDPAQFGTWKADSLPPPKDAPAEQGTGNAPWYQCWDVDTGRPRQDDPEDASTQHQPFQDNADAQRGQHVFCPHVMLDGSICRRQTVMPLENFRRSA